MVLSYKMEAKTKRKSIIFLILFVGQLFFMPILTFLDFNQSNNDLIVATPQCKDTNPKTSNNQVHHIHIDASNPKNWTWTVQNYTWCSGSGTWDDPYVIKNITVTSSIEGSGILIENSQSDYFVIRNCTIDSSESGETNAGIRLDFTSNGVIKNCTLSNNDGTGIYITGSSTNNTILSNHINNNAYVGVYIFDESSENKIINNMINGNGDNFNEGYGVYIRSQSDLNTIRNNTISSNDDGAIYLYSQCEKNDIINNSLTNNDNGKAVYLNDNCNHNEILNNIITGSHSRGVHFYRENDYNNVSRNYIADCSEYGIFSEDYLFPTLENENNIFYNNTLINPSGMNAREHGETNQWDLQGLGNYWHDYSDVDKNDDGIGDDAYQIGDSGYFGGSGVDNFPMWNDGHNGSIIKIDALDKGVNARNWTWAKTKSWCTGSGTESDPYIIKNVNLSKAVGSDYGVMINNSRDFFIIQDGNISKTSENGAGIIIKNSTNGQIINVNVSSNKGMGIYLDPTNFTTISNCYIYNNSKHGIYISEECSNNTLVSNVIFNNSIDAVHLHDNCVNHTILKNTIIGSKIGIALNISCSNNSISSNIVKNNTYGIYLVDDCQSNTFDNNSILGNEKWGVNLTTLDCKYNIFVRNNFSYNGVNANDNASNNRWNSTEIGNHWQDYTGIDIDDDGIGDKPYNISGSARSNDSLPIWYDGDNINPKLTVNYPENGTYWKAPPLLNISVIDKNLDTIWYNASGVDDIFAKIANKTLEPFNKTIWDELPEGPFNVSFYANDTDDNLNDTVKLTFFKDTIKPNLTLVSPVDGFRTGNNTFFFTVKTNDTNLDGLWYTVDGGENNYTINIGESKKFHSTQRINKTAWKSLINGSFILTFYANDTAGNINSTSIIIQKHITPEKFWIGTNISGVVENGYFRINWSFSKGADNYTIYESEEFINDVEDAGVRDIKNVINDGSESRNYNFSKLVNKNYYYIVVAYNKTGSFMTSCLKIEVFIPAEQFLLTHDAGAVNKDGIFNLTWEASPQADNYSIYRSQQYITEINGTVDLIKKHYTAFLTYQITMDYNGKYYFVVIAHNETEEVFSNNVEITIGLKPTSFIISTDAKDPDLDGTFNITWTTPQRVSYFNIYYYNTTITTLNGSLSLLKSGLTGNIYKVINFSEGIKHYIIVAYNGYDSRISSNQLKIDIDSTPPPQYFALSTDAGFPDPDGNFTLTWAPSQYAKTYSIYVLNVSKTNYTTHLIVADLKTFEYEITNFKNGKYYFYVVAKNEYGEAESNRIYLHVKAPVKIEDSSDEIEILGLSLGDLGYPVFIGITSFVLIVGIAYLLNRKRIR